MNQGGGSQQTVNGRHWPTRRSHHLPPTLSHLYINTQDASQKEHRQGRFNPIGQHHAPFGIAKPLNPFAQFAKGQDAQIQG